MAHSELYAIIDIGSNTMRLSVYKVEEGRFSVMFHKKEMASLASYVDDDDRLSKAGIRQAIDILYSFTSICECLGVESIYPFATASLRNIVNTQEVVEKIENETGYVISVLTGRQEAEYDFLGAMNAVDLSEGLLVDIGGGSTELVFFKRRAALVSASLPIGSLNLYKRFIAGLIPDENESQEICAMVARELATVELPSEKNDTTVICGVGGTIRAASRLYNAHYDLPSDNWVFDYRDLCELLEIFSQDTRENRAKILRIIPERIHTIVPGMLVLKTIAERYDCRKVVVSTCGVREGYLLTVLTAQGLM